MWRRPDDPVSALMPVRFGPLLSSTGTIRERNWFGKDGMEHVRTVKEPKQTIPTFSQTVELLMKVRPLSESAPRPFLPLQPSAREPPRQIQRGRQGSERPGEAVHAHAQDHLRAAWVGNAAGAADLARSMAPTVRCRRQDGSALSSAVIYRQQREPREEVLLG